MTRRFVEGFEWERAGDLAKKAIQSELPEDVVQEIYIINSQRKILGSVTLIQLLRAPLDTPVGSLILRTFPSISAWEDQEKAAQLFQKYGLKTLPVTDREGVLIGVITVDDILEVIEEEASEDIYRLGGVESPEIEYPRAGLWEIYRKRIIWLSLLFVSESLTSTVILHYEDYIAKLAVLAAYIPLLIGTGGNVGSQIATLIVRGFATGEIRNSDFWKVLAKELAMGMVLGLTMGLFIWLRIVTFRHTPLVAFTIGMSMVGIATFANLVGAVLPFLFRRLGIDPAITSSPFIATLMDVTGLMIYFNIARIVLDL
jgi:magnesium transporter